MKFRTFSSPLIQREQSVSESCEIKLNLDCIYVFPTDVEPNRIPFGTKLIEKNVIAIQITLVFEKMNNSLVLFK